MDRVTLTGTAMLQPNEKRNRERRHKEDVAHTMGRWEVDGLTFCYTWEMDARS